MGGEITKLEQDCANRKYAKAHPKKKGVRKKIGRPHGSKNWKTKYKEGEIAKILKSAEGYLVHEVESVLRATIEAAKNGNVAAQKLILDRVLPTRKSVEHKIETSNSWEFRVVAVEPPQLENRNGKTFNPASESIIDAEIIEDEGAEATAFEQRGEHGWDA